MKIKDLINKHPRIVDKEIIILTRYKKDMMLVINDLLVNIRIKNLNVINYLIDNDRTFIIVSKKSYREADFITAFFFKMKYIKMIRKYTRNYFKNIYENTCINI